MNTPRFLIIACALLPHLLQAADQPQWGQAWSRNMVSSEVGLPSRFNPATGENIKWSAALGSETHSTPIVADGRVYIGTNNEKPRDPKHQGDRGVLMCFNEKDGKLLWQLAVPKRSEDPYHDWPKSGISSPVTVEGERVYLVNNRGEVMCLDARGMANGNDGPYQDEGSHMTVAGEPALEPGPLDADILWLFDLTSGAGIWSHDAAHSSILIHDRYLYLNTGTGVDNTHKRIRTPDAPSLVALDKLTGRLVARDNERIAPDIFHCTWSSPSLASVGGGLRLFFAAGNGIVYGFNLMPPNIASNNVRSFEKIWQFDPDPTAPKKEVHQYNLNRREGPSNIYALPVFHDNRLFVAGGGDIFWGKTEAWLQCIDATRKGDTTASGPIWIYPLGRHVLSSPAIHDGLIYIADCGRKFHCVDERTGEAVWTHDIDGDVWASPLVADGKVYLGARRGGFWVFKAGREKMVLSEIDLKQPISATATAANGALYVATMNTLYCIGPL